MGNRLARTVLAGLLVLSISALGAVAQEEGAGEGVVVWDTGRALDAATLDLANKEGWRRLTGDGGAEHTFAGDAVIENERIVAAFCSRSGEVAVCSKGDGQSRPRMRLAVLTAAGEQSDSLGPAKIAGRTADDIVIEVDSRAASGKTARVAFRLGRGQVFLEVRPLENAGALRISAATRYAVIPDFFGDDMVFDPTQYPPGKLFIPSENFIVSLLAGGDSLVMSVWPEGEQKVEMEIGQAEEGPTLTATEITFDGKSVYAALLAAPGIWHRSDLGPDRVAEDVPLRWERPFEAKWRADFCVGRRSHSWAFRDRRTEVYIYRYTRLPWPCWFDGEKTFVHLSKRLSASKGVAEYVLIYPLERTGDTPLALFTPVDIVRETLGMGPCEYVLDREGLAHRGSLGDRTGVHGSGVCSTSGAIEYFFIRGIEARESIMVADMMDDLRVENRTINARVQEFREFAKQMAAVCERARRDAPELKPVADTIEEIAREIEAEYQEKLKTIHTPDHVVKLGEQLKALTGANEPENLGAAKALLRELRDIGGTQHRMIGDYRVAVKRLRQEAVIAAATQPAAIKFAEQIRDLAQQVLRHRYGVEGE